MELLGALRERGLRGKWPESQDGFLRALRENGPDLRMLLMD
jgi:hypothetical protein